MRTRMGVLVATLLVGWAAVLPAPAGAVPSQADGQDVGQDAHGERAAQERVESAPSQDPLQISLLSATGVRAASSTVLVGAVLNRSDRGRTVTVRLDDLPSDVQLLRVLPSASQPEQGRAWACEGRSCDLVDQDGRAVQLPAGEGVGLQLVLAGTGVAPGGGFQVSVDGGASVRVAFDRPDGAPALPDRAITVGTVGPDMQVPGATTTTAISVGNVSAEPVAAGSLTVRWSGQPTGVTSTAAGQGWTCAPSGPCTYGPEVPALGQAAPLVLTNATSADAADSSSTFVVTAAAQVSAQVGATAVQADTSTTWRVRPPTASGLSASIELSATSVSPPAITTATIAATPIGQGPLVEPAELRLELPDGVSADWSAASSRGPWRCDDAQQRCVSEGPLSAGVDGIVQVPLRVARGTAADLVHVRVRTQVQGRTGVGSTDDASAGLVVNPPPVAELRAQLRAANADGVALAALPEGEPLDFATGVPRPLVVVVTNQGSRAAAEGSSVDVELRPDVTQRVASIGGPGWRCSDVDRLDASTPMRCSLQLDRELPSGDSVSLPMTLAPSEQGSSRWTVTSGGDGRLPASSARHVRVDVGTTAPKLVPRTVVSDELVRGGTGQVQVRLVNDGDAVARGGVLLIDLPTGVQPSGIRGQGWTCAEATLRRANGSLSCALEADVEVGQSSAPLQLEMTADTDRDRVTAWFWATSPGQAHSGARDGVALVLDVHRSVELDGGSDLTVVTPVRGPDGVERPAVVQLSGTVPQRLRDDVRWEQLCTRPAERGCDGVAPAVSWLGLDGAAQPRTARAAFVAPELVEAPVTLRFRLLAGAGSAERSDEVQVRLVPARLGSVAATAATSSASGATTGPRGSGADQGSSARAGQQPAAPPTAPADKVLVSVGDGSTLQVATRTGAVLTAAATGTAPFTYRWEQIAGPTATITGTTSSAELAFLAPDLEPDETSQDLTFEVTVTDALGNTATAQAQVEVVWGDDGLQVQLAGGAPSVVATVGTPLAVTSLVTSAGAPYTYEWSVQGDLELPSGTTTDAATLSFTAPSSPATGDATLQVTDSFGRVTEASVELSVTRLPSGVVPAALCTALAQLGSGSDATLTGALGSVVVQISAQDAQVDGDPGAPTSSSTTSTTSSTTSTTTSTSTPAPSTSAPSSSTTSSTPSATTVPGGGTTTTTTTTAPPTPTCPEDAVATFTGATVTLPGGISVAGAAGELSIAGITLSAGAVSVPGNWGPVALRVPSQGLLLPFVSSTAIDVPTGVLSGSGAPFLSPSGWSSTSQVGFAGGSDPRALVSSVGAPPSGPGALSASGTSTGAGATAVDVRVRGLIGLGPVDVPLSGTVTTVDAAAAPSYGVQGSLTATPLSADVTVGELDVQWTPTSAAGTLRLVVGDSASPLVLSGNATFDGDDAQLGFAEAGAWTPAGSEGPALALSGTGSISDDDLSLTLASPAAAAWSPVRSVQLRDLTARVAADCELSTTGTCAPSVELAGVADLQPTGAASVPVSGTLDLQDASTVLSGAAGVLQLTPLEVDGAELSVTMSPSTTTTVSAEGSSEVLGVQRATSVSFGADAVVAVAQLGDRQLVPGWTLSDTVALATDQATSYELADGAASAPVQLSPGQLVGAAATSLPAAMADGVLPPELSSGVITFPIDGPSPGSYLMTVSDQQGWDVLGGPDAPMQLSVDQLGFVVTADGSSATVQVNGAGALRVDPVTTGGDAPLTLSLAGTLSSDGGSGVLAATLSAQTWSDAVGVAGLSLSDVAVRLQVTPAAATAQLSGAATLPAPLATNLGATTGSVPASAQLDPQSLCLGIDLDTTGPAAIDPGGSGLLATDSATVVVSPEGCSWQGDQLDAGVVVRFDSTQMGPQQLTVDPSTGALSGQVDLGAATVGGVPLTGATVRVDTPAARPYLLSGDLVLDGSGSGSPALSVEVAGPVLPAAPGMANGSVELVGVDTELTVGATTFSVGSLTVAPTALLGQGTAQLQMAVQFPLLGTTADLSATSQPGGTSALSGSITNGSVGPLTGTLGSATYDLADGDQLQAAFTVLLGPPADSTAWRTSITSTATSVLTFGGFTVSSAEVTITPDGFDLTGTTPLPGGLAGTPAAVAGSYPFGAGATGAEGELELTTPSDATLSLAGFSGSGTATFGRSDGELAASQTVTVSPGLFDSDTSITVTGDLIAPAADGDVPTTTLRNDTGVDAALRGLEGVATLTFTPGTGKPGSLGWYDATLQFAASDSTCPMWAAPPTLEGQIYRNDDTTYYTLTSWVQPSLAAGLVISPVSGAPPQPVVLSNEVVEGEQPAPGVTIQLGLQTSTFVGQGLLSLSVGSCSYTIGAVVMLTFNAGSQSAALGQNLGGASPAVTVTSQLFGPGQELPEAISLVRREYQSQALATQIGIQRASLEQAFETANQQAEAAATVNEGLQRQAAASMAELDAANARLAAAQRALSGAPNAQAAQAAQDEVDQAEDQVQDVADRVAAAQQQVSAAADALWQADSDARDAQALADQGEFDQMVAEGVATTAGSDLAKFEQAAAQQEAQQKAVKTLQISAQYTHCPTCKIEDVAELDGQLYFAESYLAGVDLTVGWGEGQLDEVTGTFSVGWMKQYTVGWSHLYLYGMVEVEAMLTVGWTDQAGWDEVDIGVEATADITAYLDLWFATYSATLAQVQIDGTLALLPSPATLSGSAEIDVFGFSDTFSF